MSRHHFSKMLRTLSWRQNFPEQTWGPDPASVHRDSTEVSREAFREFRSSSRRSFFPHRVCFLPKAGPESLRLARWMTGIRTPDSLWEIVIHAHEVAYDGIPESLFFDPEIVWHGQHLGRPGHVAYACLARRGRTLFALNYVSDVVQRISRRPDYRSRVENSFSGWPDLIVNAVLHLAVETGCRWIRSPTADFVLRFTDPARQVGKELFDRVYDRTLQGTLNARKTGRWWVADVKTNAERCLPLQLVRSEASRPHSAKGRTICLFHEIEGGAGHRKEDPEFAMRAESMAPDHLEGMLQIEKEHRVTATYNVVGRILEKVRGQIERDNHCLAFHSFDHALKKRQLDRCRRVDYRLRGYRPPQSRLTKELTDESLCWHNFDWLALAANQVGQSVPVLRNRVVKIPILADDYALYRQGTSFDQWADQVFKRAREGSFAAIGLHDCYGEWWLPQYDRFLASLARFGQFQTLDQVADQLFLQATI